MSDPADWPTVSVVMPIRNEADDLERSVASILTQEYPVPFDVCLAVAPSDDGTESIARSLAERHDRVSVVTNPAGTTPTGLNVAIAATTGEVVVRVDGHAELSDGYIRRAVDTMRRTGAVNVGGMQVPAPRTTWERAVAAATTSWMGTGGARYRVGGGEGAVDTVYLGVFDRRAGAQVGWFDETLIRNQDYELNVRLRDAGGIVWFDPVLSVRYRPRGSVRALASQYAGYGFWKAEVLRRHPDSLRPRQAIPPLAVPAIAIATLLGLGGRRAALAVPAAYGCAVTSSIGLRHGWRSAVCVATMHASWAAGFWRRLLLGPRRSRRRCPGDGPAPALS